MSFFKTKSNIVFSIVVFLLVIAIALLGFVVYRQNDEYVKASTSLTDNEALLAEAESKISEYSAELEKSRAEAQASAQKQSELESQLQSAIDEKQKLEQENSGLKKQIEELTVRKELQREIALNNVNQADAAEGGVCYLTFDDGPSDNTLKILDILDSYGIKATFFVVGTAKTDYLPIIQSKGHAIGLHSATHSYSQIYASVSSYLGDLKGISDIVHSKTGIRSNVIRFPGGSSNSVSRKYCEGIMTELTTLLPTMGYSYYDWNVSSGDASAKSVPAATIVSNVLNGARGKSSICVLMHDTSAKGTTVEALPSMIEGLHAMGFRFAPLTAQVYGFHQSVIN